MNIHRHRGVIQVTGRVPHVVCVICDKVTFKPRRPFWGPDATKWTWWDRLRVWFVMRFKKENR